MVYVSSSIPIEIARSERFDDFRLFGRFLLRLTLRLLRLLDRRFDLLRLRKRRFRFFVLRLRLLRRFFLRLSRVRFRFRVFRLRLRARFLLRLKRKRLRLRFLLRIPHQFPKLKYRPFHAAGFKTVLRFHYASETCAHSACHSFFN